MPTCFLDSIVIVLLQRRLKIFCHHRIKKLITDRWLKPRFLTRKKRKNWFSHTPAMSGRYLWCSEFTDRSGPETTLRLFLLELPCAFMKAAVVHTQQLSTDPNTYTSIAVPADFIIIPTGNAPAYQAPFRNT
jgi:hypothetical protein